MKFSIVSNKSGLCLAEVDETADAVRLKEGAPHLGHKRPLDLAPGEETVVSYPLHSTFADGTSRAIVCRVIRVDGMPTHDEASRKAVVEREAQAAVEPALREAPPMPAPSPRRRVRPAS